MTDKDFDLNVQVVNTEEPSGPSNYWTSVLTATSIISATTITMGGGMSESVPI